MVRLSKYGYGRTMLRPYTLCIAFHIHNTFLT